MNKDYNLTREQMESFAGQVKKNRTAFLEKFVELRFQISKLVTAEEWQASKQVQRE
jgi:hypothetical protein